MGNKNSEVRMKKLHLVKLLSRIPEVSIKSNNKIIGMTVLDIKNIIFTIEGIPADQQRLIIMGDDKTNGKQKIEYNIAIKHLIFQAG